MIGPRSHDLKPTLVSASKASALPVTLLVSEHLPPRACLEVSIPAPSRLVDSEPSRVVSFRGRSGLVSMFEDHQFSSVAQSCPSLAIPWTAACQASLSITSFQSLLKLISITLVMPPNHLILCHPFSSHLPSFPASGSFQMSQFFTSIRWPKYWSFSFSIGPSNEYSGLISFRMDWSDLLEVQRTLKSLLQHHSSKASILCYSAFFLLQLSHPYTTNGKTIALTRG